MSFKVSSVQEYFETLEKRFNADGAKGVNAIYQFDLGDDGTYHVHVEGGEMTLHEGAHDKPTTTITIDLCRCRTPSTSSCDRIYQQLCKRK